MNKNMNKTKFIALTGIMASLATVLQLLDFPIVGLFPAYLKIDLSDIPAVLGAIAAGPLAGVAIELIKNILHFMLKNNTPFGSGEIANFFAGIGYVIPLSLILSKKGKNTLSAYVVAAISMVIIANVMNYFITLPLYGVNKEAIMPTILTTLIPFNLFKAVVISIPVAVLYNKTKYYMQKLNT